MKRRGYRYARYFDKQPCIPENGQRTRSLWAFDGFLSARYVALSHRMDGTTVSFRPLPLKITFVQTLIKKIRLDMIYLYACVHAPRTKIYFALIKITFLLRYYRIPGLALMNENWFPFQSLQGCRGSGKRFNGSLYHPADKRINRSRVFIKESHGTWHFPRDKSSLSLLPVPTYLLYIYIHASSNVSIMDSGVKESRKDRIDDGEKEGRSN